MSVRLPHAWSRKHFYMSIYLYTYYIFKFIIYTIYINLYKFIYIIYNIYIYIYIFIYKVI